MVTLEASPHVNPYFSKQHIQGLKFRDQTWHTFRLANILCLILKFSVLPVPFTLMDTGLGVHLACQSTRLGP